MTHLDQKPSPISCIKQMKRIRDQNIYPNLHAFDLKNDYSSLKGARTLDQNRVFGFMQNSILRQVHTYQRIGRTRSCLADRGI